MKKTMTLLFMMWSFYCASQVLWEFPIYFEDDRGFRDTITLAVADGAHDNAADPFYDEIKIEAPWRPTFEVRLWQGWDNFDGFPVAKGYKRVVYGADYFLQNNFALNCSFLFNNFEGNVRIYYDSTLIQGYNFTNMVYDRSRLSPLAEPDWQYIDDNFANSHEYPESAPMLQCLQHRSEIIETFSHHDYADSVNYQDLFYNVQEQNSIGRAFACDIKVFTPWSGDGYCDAPVSADEVAPIRWVDFIKINPLVRGGNVDIIDAENPYQPVDWRLINMKGTVVNTGTTADMIHIPIGPHPAGMYVLQVKQDKMVQTEKIVVVE